MFSSLANQPSTCSTPRYFGLAATLVHGEQADVIVPEQRISVHPGQLVAIPLFDGKVVDNAEWHRFLAFIAISNARDKMWACSRYGSVGSARAAIFRVIGPVNAGGQVQVLLRSLQRVENVPVAALYIISLAS